MANCWVRPFVRVVANGVAAGKLKVTFILTPQKVSCDSATAPSGAFDLANWPLGMREWLMRKRSLSGADGQEFVLPVEFIPLESGEAPVETHLARVDKELFASKAHWSEISVLWNSIFSDSGTTDAFESLLDELERSLQGKKHSAKLISSYGDLPEEPPGTNPANPTAGDFDLDGAMRVDPLGVGDKLQFSGVVAVRQGDFGVESEWRRALQVKNKLDNGLSGDAPKTKGPCDAKSADATDTSAKGEGGKLEIRKALYGEFRENVRHTNAQRSATENVFRTVKTSLESGAQISAVDLQNLHKEGFACCDAALPCTLEPAKDQSLLASETVTQIGASTAYSQTLQRSTRPNGPGSHDGCPVQRGYDKTRSFYFALQGDPVLSRLFLLTIDAEIDFPQVPPEASKYFLLGFRDDDAGSNGGPVRVVTGAKISSKYFWPVSRFEVTAGPEQRDKCKALTEQADGVWNLGLSIGVRPRYDSPSVDVRRAIDFEPRKSEGVRNDQLMTAGLNIIDRGRGGQVAAELAVATFQFGQLENKQERISLFAEELTIGRCIQIAAVPPGTDPADVQWRSLMSRYVRYSWNNGNVVNGLIARLMGQRSQEIGILDEGSIQLAVRSIPKLRTDGQGSGAVANGVRQVEAVPEEAIFLWDGTPAGALTDADGDEHACDTGPIRRRYELPSAPSRLRPPPLRFGVTYVISMTSRFLGGGGPSLADVREKHKDTKGALTLPPAIGGKMAPRAFLRHENILAPTILMPEQIALRRNGKLGYEMPELAVVRSIVDSGEDSDRDAPHNQPYAPLQERSGPENTVRVFIPPAVSLDMAVRHRKLDDANATDVLNGALRDIFYDQDGAGFPIAVAERTRAFNGDEVIYRRTIQDTAADGIAVFRPDSARRKGKNVYLPDPAAEKWTLRLRNKGSGFYLEGAMTAELYDSRGYPHAIPLAVSVSKRAARRPTCARHVDEVIVMERNLVQIDKYGKVGSGAKVRLAKLELAPGEEFELEVSCLPSRETLSKTFALPEDLAVLRSVGEKIANPIRRGIDGRELPPHSAIEAEATGLIEVMATGWPIEEIANVTRLTVCHAVNAPQDPPHCEQGKVSISRPPNKTKDACQGGDKDVTEMRAAPDEVKSIMLLLKGPLELDLEQVDSFEIVATTVGATGKPLDDPARSRSPVDRRAGRWPSRTVQYGKKVFLKKRDVVGFHVNEDGSIVLPEEKVTLLRVDNLPHPLGVERDESDESSKAIGDIKGRLTTLDLGILHAHAILNRPLALKIASARPEGQPNIADKHTVTAKQPEIIADSKARRLKLSVVALSRHANLFETAPQYINAVEQLLHRRQPLKSSDQKRTSPETFDVWMKATERPPKCDARQPTRNFDFERTAHSDKGIDCQELHRHASTRLYFGRGWFASGEGERVGIVLWPPNYREALKDRGTVLYEDREMDLSDFRDSDIGPAGQFITRWAGDPIRKDVAPEFRNFIPFENFREFNDDQSRANPHKPQYVPCAWMPTRQPKEGEEGKADFVPVSLLTYEPCFDLDREEWYVDVDLRPGLTTDPFVRFGLVRYQENAITEKLSVSEPDRVWSQLLPRRDVTLLSRESIVARSDASPTIFVDIAVRGQGSVDIKPVELGLRDFPEAYKKLRTPRLSATVVHEMTDANGIVRRTPVFEEELTAMPAIVDGLLLWSLQFQIDPKRRSELGSGQYYVFLKETELRMPATYPKEPISERDMFREESFRQSGPRFSARIAFKEVT